MTSLTLDPAADIRYKGVADAALSDDAETLRRPAAGQNTSLIREGRVYQMQLALLQTFQEHAKPDWDGYGARAASFAAFEKTWQLLPALPTQAPIPEFVVHPDGEMALEWRRGRGDVLTLTVSEDIWLKWASLIGGERAHGRIPFSGSLPPAIVRAIARLSRTARAEISR